MPIVDGPAGIQIPQHIERDTGRQHGPGSKEQQIVEGIQILLPGGQGGDAVQNQNNAVAVALLKASYKGQHHHQLQEADNDKNRA